MALTMAGRNAMLDNLGTLAAFVSLHTADPGATGANAENTGGAYARKAISWSPASNGTKSQSGSVTFDVPAGGGAVWVAFWSAATGGTCYGTDDLSAPQTSYTSAGQYVLSGANLAQA